MKFKKYTTKPILVKKFELGDEDGFTCYRSLCEFKDENGDWKQCNKCNLGNIPYIHEKMNTNFESMSKIDRCMYSKDEPQYNKLFCRDEHGSQWLMFEDELKGFYIESDNEYKPLDDKNE